MGYEFGTAAEFGTKVFSISSYEERGNLSRIPTLLGSSGKTQPNSYGLYRLGESQPKSAVPKVAEANPRAHLIYFTIRISPTQHTGKSQSKLQFSTVYLRIKASTLSAVTRPSLTTYAKRFLLYNRNKRNEALCT